MSNVRPFQVVLIAFFAVLALIAIVFLTTYQAKKTTEEKAYGDSVIIWGTLPQEIIKTALQEVARSDKAFSVVEYRQFDEATFNEELINAIAENRSPDLIVLSSPSLVSLRSKLFAIPYTTITQRSLKDAYIDGASIFALVDGVYGLPFAVDPLVMYWNTALFATNGIAQAPTTWQQVQNEVVPKITISDSRHELSQSGVSFGGYSNVSHGKGLLTALLWQLGSQMIFENNGVYTVALDEPVAGASQAPFYSVVEFYTRFSSNPNSRSVYSWNNARPQDTTAFISGELGLYFGPGSEYRALENKNPNLKFDVAPIPQGEGATVAYTSGDFYAFAIPKAAKNPQVSFAVANILASAPNADSIARGLSMAPVRRDLISKVDADPFRQVILKSALIAHGWLDPNPKESDGIFKAMVESINGDSSRISEAVSDAATKLSLHFR